MDQHTGVLQQGIHPPAVRRDRGQGLERVRREGEDR
jgi:hypothetical protein